MAIAYGSQGTGSTTESSGGDLAPTCPASVAANDILIAHVFYEGVVTTPDTPSGWTLLYGPLTDAGNNYRSWVFGKIASGSEDGTSISFGTPAVTTVRTGRIYSFTGYSSGTISEIVRGFDTAYGGPEVAANMPVVNVTRTGSLAVALIAGDDDATVAAAGVVTGGTWAEPVAEYTQSATTPDTLLDIQTASGTAVGSVIKDGTAAFDGGIGNVFYHTIGFEIMTDPGVGFVYGETSGAGNGGDVNMGITDAGIFGIKEGDLVIFSVLYAGTANLVMGVVENGWTQLCDVYANDSQDANLGVWAKFMGSTPDTSVTFDGDATGANSSAATIMVFRGVDQSCPFDAATQSTSGIDTVNANPPSITPVSTTGRVSVAIGGGAGAFGAGVVYDGPSGYTTNFKSFSVNDSVDSMIGTGYNLAPANPENPGAYVINGAADSVNYSWAAATLMLRPKQITGIRMVGSPVSGDTPNGGDITLTLPTTIAENDLVVVAYAEAINSDHDMAMTTAGYTQVADLYQDDTQDTNLGVFIKKMGASPDATAVTDGSADAGAGNAAVAMVFRGVDQTTPQDVTATTVVAASTALANPASINPADATGLVVIASAAAHTLGASGGFQLPADYLGIVASGNDTNDASVALMCATVTVAGDPADAAALKLRSGQSDNAAFSYASCSMVLRTHVAATGQLHIWIGVVGI